MTLDHTSLVCKLVGHYCDATPTEIQNGREWYADAQEFAAALAAASPYSTEQCAYVIAALSPNVAWGENKASATAAVDGHRVGIDPRKWRGAGYGANKVKAARILDGDLDALQGPKVTMFARGIVGDPDACTVDIWMQRAVGMDTGSAPTKTEHAAIRAAIEHAAQVTGETVREFQAIVWTKVRNETLSKTTRHAWRVQNGNES